MTQSPPPGSSTAYPTSGNEGSTGLVDQAHDKVGQLVDQAQHTAGQVTEQAKQQATSQLESQKERGVDSLVTVAQALRQTGQHLREQEQGTVGEYVEKAAERVEGLTNYLRSKDVTQLVGETQEFARRQPVLFLGTALALGFAGARFLMSSGQRASQRQRALSSPRATAGTYRGYGGSQGAPLYGQTPPGRNPAYMPPGPVATAEPAGVRSALGEIADLGGDSGAPNASGADPWRRSEAENV
jgi:ElaB/YqjD/DUF883 family membrane-anchored ribosome-binding protein